MESLRDKNREVCYFFPYFSIYIYIYILSYHIPVIRYKIKRYWISSTKERNKNTTFLFPISRVDFVFAIQNLIFDKVIPKSKDTYLIFHVVFFLYAHTHTHTRMYMNIYVCILSKNIIKCIRSYCLREVLKCKLSNEGPMFFSILFKVFCIAANIG